MRHLDKFRQTGSVQDNIEKSQWPVTVKHIISQRNCETMFEAVSKEIKTLVPVDRFFKEFSYEYNAPGSSSVFV